MKSKLELPDRIEVFFYQMNKNTESEISNSQIEIQVTILRGEKRTILKIVISHFKKYLIFTF